MHTNKEYHLYLYHYIPPEIITTVHGVEFAVQTDMPKIETIQIVTCTTDLFRHGYRIFVHPSARESYEITLGLNPCGREIRMGHCLYKLIIAGEFDKKGVSVS